MEELKLIEREDLYVGDAFEGTHNYYNIVETPLLRRLWTSQSSSMRTIYLFLILI